MIVATYNIHRWTGRDGRRDPERTLRALEQLDADLVALQEVDAPAEGVDPATFLHRRTDLHAISGPTLLEHSGSYGNLVLSRPAIAAVRRIDLSVERSEPRGAIDLDLLDGATPRRVLATHLGLRRRERRIQIDRLLAAVDADTRQPSVLLGDFNEWTAAGGGLRQILRRMSAGPRRGTYPAGLPWLALDRIFFDRQARLTDLRVLRSEATRLASDHLPLRAVLHWAD